MYQIILLRGQGKVRNFILSQAFEEKLEKIEII